MTASALLDGGPASRTERAYPSLDGARALAATVVVATHAAFYSGTDSAGLVGRVFGRFDVGVAIFFVLSGFLLSRPVFLAMSAGRELPRAAAYLWRRALRILPAYWLMVTATLLLLPGNDGIGPGDWARHLTLVQNYFDAPFGAGLSHTWSLSTEATFYLLLPVAAVGLARLSGSRPDRPVRVLAALGAATALGMAWLAWVWEDRPFALPLDLWLPSFAGWFATGMALAVLSVSDPVWGPVRVARELGSSLPTCWTAAGSLFFLATTTVAGPFDLSVPTPAEALTKSALYLGIGGLLVLPLVFGDQRQGATRRVLSSPLVTSLGEISYGLFLVHMPILVGGYTLLGRQPFTGNLLVVLIAVWIVSVGVATAVHALVELPTRRWRKLLPDTPRSRTPISTEATTADTATSAAV